LIPPSRYRRLVFLSSALQMIANIAINVFATLLTITFIQYKPWQQELTPRVERPPRPEPLNAKGKRITLADVDWAASKRTVVIALSVGCRFFTESAPFYKRLAEMEALGKTDARIVAVFPQSLDMATDYLASLKVPITTVKQASLTTLFVGGTPTVLLLDDTGMVTDVWIGRLDAEREEEVLKKVQATRI